MFSPPPPQDNLLAVLRLLNALMSLNNCVADNNANHYTVTRSRVPVGLLYPPVVIFQHSIVCMCVRLFLFCKGMHTTVNNASNQKTNGKHLWTPHRSQSKLIQHGVSFEPTEADDFVSQDFYN